MISSSPKPFLKKPVVVAAIGLFCAVLLLLGIKAMQIGTLISSGKEFAPPPETVTTANVRSEQWETTLTAVGSLTATEGVMLSAQLAGQVVKIDFEPGSTVSANDLLIQQDIDAEQAQLRAALAAVDLAKINLQRSSDLLSKKLTSQSDHDAASARYKEAIAQADAIRALIDKKTIRAPFSGQVGTKRVYLGQHLREGDTIASLQALDRLIVNFALPQQYLPKLAAGLPVRITTNALPGQSVAGDIQAIDSAVDVTTRNIEIQASIANPDNKLLPGLFVNVEVILPESDPVLCIPATSVIYASYGASVFVVEPAQDEKTGATVQQAHQQFVKLGRTQGDFVEILSGLKENDVVVSTGAFKLYNGQNIVANNGAAPEFKLNPKPENG